MRKRREEHVVGFYKDEHGKARPITKSDQESRRLKVIENPREFRSIGPEETSLTRKLKRLNMELEKLGRKFENVCNEEEAEALIKLGEAKFREANEIEKRLFEKQKKTKA